LIATVLPEDAHIKDVIWTTNNPAVATVVNGKVKGISVGTATITVTTKDGGYTDTCVVTVEEPLMPPTSITVSPKTFALKTGDTYTLTAEVKPTTANQTVTWSSSNNAIATVDAYGVVTAIGAGKTIITATTVNGLSATSTITVTLYIPVEEVIVDPASCTIPLKGAKVLKATVSPTNATNRTVTWSSSDITIATVNATGIVTAKNINGTVTIYATADGITGTCIVTVGNGGLPMDIEETDIETITVYPNPTNGELRITNYESRIENIEIFDMLGRSVGTNLCVRPENQTSEIGQPDIEINISDVPSGVYFIRIQTENGRIVTRKVVKQ